MDLSLYCQVDVQCVLQLMMILFSNVSLSKRNYASIISAQMGGPLQFASEFQPKNNDCCHFQDNWEFVTDRATTAQRFFFFFLRLQESSRKAFFCRKLVIEKRKKRFFYRFLSNGILSLSHFSTNAGKVMPWTENTFSITWK